MNEPAITAELVQKHNLTPEEFEKVDRGRGSLAARRELRVGQFHPRARIPALPFGGALHRVASGADAPGEFAAGNHAGGCSALFTLSRRSIAFVGDSFPLAAVFEGRE